MSGPKVFHIVTREEIIAICERLLARLDAAIREWERIGNRNDLINEEDRKVVAEYRKKWRDALANDQFVELQKGVPDLVAWLNTDMQNRFEQKLSAQTKRRKTLRHLEGTAEMLLKRLEAKGVAVPADVLAMLKGASSAERSMEKLSTAVSKGLGLLALDKNEELTPRQMALLEQLRIGTETTSLEAWLGQQPEETEEDKRISHLERHIEEIRIVDGDETAMSYQDRLRELKQISDSKRRSMLLDSLTVEFAGGVRRARDVVRAKAELQAVRAEINATQTSTLQSLVTRIDSQLEGKDAQAMRDLANEAKSALDAEMAARVMALRRESILRGLAALGYEVKEGMATAWTKVGRIVLRKPVNHDYGVELSGGRDAVKIQMRVVAASGAARSAVRDRDAETIWCGDVDKLRGALAQTGTDLAIEKSLPIGAAPLKVVPQVELGLGGASSEGQGLKGRQI